MASRSETGEALAASALDNARAVAPVLRAAGDRIEADRALPPDIVAAMHEALEAAEELAARGISAEVVDPRTLSPLDIDTIAASVRKSRFCAAIEGMCGIH